MRKTLQKSILILGIASLGFSGQAIAQAANWQWAISGGAASTDESGAAITSDANNNVISTGSFSSDMTIGGVSLKKFGGYGGNVYIVKQKPTGEVIWAKSFGGNNQYIGGGSGAAISTDGDGNIYVTGVFYANLVVGTTTLTSLDTTATNLGDIFIAKLNASGDVMWAKSAGGTVSEMPTGISVDANKNVFITGSFRSHTIKFDAIALTSSNNTSASYFFYTDIFVAKYNSSGEAQWAKMAGGSNVDEGKSISADKEGNVIVAGTFYYPSINFGSVKLTATAALSMFVVKYNASGEVLWAKTPVATGSGSINHGATGVMADEKNNIYVTGSFGSETLTFDSVVLTSKGGSNFFIVKYAPNGNAIWGTNEGNSYGMGISANKIGKVYAVGYFTGKTTTFGSATLTNNNTAGNNEDVFVVSYDSSGTTDWAKSLGGTYREIGNAVATVGPDVVITGKMTSNTVAVGSINLTSGGSGTYSDIFIAKAGIPEGIEEHGNVNVAIYPNPANGIFNVTMDASDLIKVSEINVSNVLGENILSQELNSSKNQIDLSNQPKGIYFLHLLNRKAVVQTKKIIVE